MTAQLIPFPGSPTAKIEDACREIRALRDRKLAELLLELERYVHRIDSSRTRTDALLASIERDAAKSAQEA